MTHPKTSDTHTKPLDQFPVGTTVTITGLCDCPKARARLCSMGLTPGTTVIVESNGSGPRRLRVRGVSIVLGRGLCQKLLACAGASESHASSRSAGPADMEADGHCICGGTS